MSQAIHQLVLFSRRPAAVFFVSVMPLILLCLFTEIFGNELVEGEAYTTAQFYSPALAVFGVVSACYTYLAVSTASARDQGVLKRIRGTPLPPSTYICARILAVTVIAMASATIVMLAGAAFYGVHLYPEKLPAALIVLVVGSFAFAALGMMVVALCRSNETTQAVANATLLPLAFLSNIFIRPFHDLPLWMTTAADIFPLKHFSLAFGDAFRPDLTGTGFAWQVSDGTYTMLPHLANMAVWGIAAAAIASRFFVWDPADSR
ncbi:ABC-2 type transport system permease protein [Rhodoligotrophos appendicifer]|uniref:ABC transporter permease n=1 Tax=Rhodoligotrophos appendicifer TaxID=987056 RepID=UPI0011862598|nr:ABC transporter permease [Rhodoligotrophos appendicifer]